MSIQGPVSYPKNPLAIANNNFPLDGVDTPPKCVLPDVRIPEREERRLSRQCNSQKGKFITDSNQGFLLQPTQWAGSEKP